MGKWAFCVTVLSVVVAFSRLFGGIHGLVFSFEQGITVLRDWKKTNTCYRLPIARQKMWAFMSLCFA